MMRVSPFVGKAVKMLEELVETPPTGDECVKPKPDPGEIPPLDNDEVAAQSWDQAIQASEK